MRRFSILCSYVAGLAFIVSGFFKLLDPIGTGFIMEEYFRFLHLGFLRGIAVAAGIAVSAIEFILGGLLVIRFKMRFTAVAALVMMAFYMLLTLFLAIFNPPMDCGCFGEAVHLTPDLPPSVFQKGFDRIYLPQMACRLQARPACHSGHRPSVAVPALPSVPGLYRLQAFYGLV